MQKLRIIFTWSLMAIVLFFGVGIYTGYRLFKPKPQEIQKVNAQAILTAMHDRGFLVSQTYIFDTPITIDRSSGNALKDFFFGQTIEARGTMEVNLGVDLAEVKNEDVRIDSNTNTITVTIPPSTLFNTRLVGPIELKNTQGVLKRILNSDDGYNEALSLLSKTAEEMAQRTEITDRANERAQEDIARMLGYISGGKMIRVNIREK